MNGAPGAADPATQTILIVDDAGMVRRRCNQLLSERRYNVLEAGNGFEALTQYERNKPDAVLLDVTMPEMDGLKALKEIIKLDPQARVVMVTGMSEQTIVMDALKAGAKDFVTKPFQADRLLAAVERALS